MAQTLIVVDKLSDWAPYQSSEQVVTFADYLQGNYAHIEQRTRVINLCSSYRYLSDGYYCSLLAEARGHRVIPSVKTVNDLGKKTLYRLHLDDLSQTLASGLKDKDPQEPIIFRSYFGTTSDPNYRDLARKLFERFPCPIMEITLVYKKQWEIDGLKLRSHLGLSEAQETTFANALDVHSKKVWRKTPARKQARFDLAILVNPEELQPPSNKGAIRRFVEAGRELGIDVELIQAKDYLRLPEFDGLFIRETTAIDHHTYRFAQKADSEGMVVIDDPSSILRCTNKIYLADLFRTNQIPTPKTVVLYKGHSHQLEDLEATLGYPMVIKIPDGAFSQGVTKVHNRQELTEKLSVLFRQSALVLVQEFLYTDFDWRIGVFNNKPLFACRYYMVKNHWQIYRYDAGKTTDEGDFDTLATFEVPKQVLHTAIKACSLIGDGLYGIDMKEKDGKGYVIEINDNPNIDHNIEDKYLGDELYQLIMAEFLRRMEARRE